jgi:hypothetical protein
MRSPGSLKLKLLGGLAGVLFGVVLTAVWFTVPSTSYPRSDATVVVGTLSGVEPAGGNAGTLSEKADALSKIIEARLRAKEFDKALDLLQRANTFKLAELDQIYENAANVVLKPAVTGGEDKDREKYLEDYGGKAAVLERLPYLYKMARQAPVSPVKVTLLLRMRNIYDFVGMGGGASVAALQALPGAETLMEDASRIAHALPSGTSSWLPWAIGGVCTVVLGIIGVVLLEMIQECARCVAQEFVKEFGLGRSKIIEPKAAQ